MLLLWYQKQFFDIYTFIGTLEAYFNILTEFEDSGRIDLLNKWRWYLNNNNYTSQPFVLKHKYEAKDEQRIVIQTQAPFMQWVYWRVEMVQRSYATLISITGD